MLELRKLEYLVAVDREESLKGATRRLILSWQALSGSMRGLECDVGAELLARQGGGIKMLPAILALIGEASVLHGFDNPALLWARRADRNKLATVLEVRELIHQVRDVIPDLATNVDQRYLNEIDIGLSRAMKPALGLIRTQLTTHRLRLWPLGIRSHSPRWSGEPIIAWGALGKSGSTDLLIQVCRNAGFNPLVHRNPIQGTPPVTAVIGTSNVAFVTEACGPVTGGLVLVLERHPLAQVPVYAVIARRTRSDPATSSSALTPRTSNLPPQGSRSDRAITSRALSATTTDYHRSPLDSRIR